MQAGESAKAALVENEAKIKPLSEKAAQVEVLQTKLSDSETAKQAAEKQAAAAETALTQTKQELTAKADKLKTAETDLATAREEITKISAAQAVQAQMDLVPNLKQQIATLQDQLSQMETSSTLLKKEMATAATATTAAQEATKQADALKAENAALKQQVEQAKAAAQPMPQAEPPVTPAAGVPEAKPTAAATPAPVTPDQDKDGVSDAADLCAKSAAGSAVNALGCPADRGIIVEGVNFKSGTAVFTPESQKILDKVAAALGHAPQVKIEVAGYTDAAGNPQKNLELSKQRAQAVAGYLATKGVAAERLSATGFGQEQPIADNTTPTGRQKNRRVELHPLAH